MTPQQDQPDNTTPPPLPNNQYFKVLNLCDLIWSQPFTVFSQNAICFLTIALFASGLRAFLAFVFDMVNGTSYGADYGTDADVSGFDYNVDVSSNSDEMDFATFWMNLVDAVILYVVTCLADGATVQVVSEMYAGQAPTSNAVVALGTVAYQAVPLVGSLLLITTGLTGLFLILIPIAFVGRPGGVVLMFALWMAIAVYVSLITFVVYPAIVVEHKGIIDSIQRSVHMTSGHLGKIFAVLVVYSLFKAILGIIAVAITFQYEAAGSRAAFWSRCVMSFCINTFFIAVRSIIKAVIYFNIRIADEDLNQEKLAQEMGLIDSYTQMKDMEMEKPTTTSTTTPAPVASETTTPADAAETTKVADKEVV